MSEEQEQHWYYLANGEQYGPVSAEQLQELAVGGTITADTQVWTEALDQWIAASDIEGLLPEAPQPATGGRRLVTGAAAQTAAPLAAAPQSVAAPAPQQPAQFGFSLGGSLAGGPHVAPGAAVHGALVAGSEQRLQIRSIGIVQAGVVFAVVGAVTALLYALLMLVFGGMLVGASGDSELVSGLAGAAAIMTIAGPLVCGVGGFLYGMVAALLYNLAAKMCGGLIMKVQPRGSW